MSEAEIKSVSDQEVARRSRRAFLTLGAGAIAGVVGWRWLWSGEDSDDLPSRIRKVLDFNRRVSSGLLYRNGHLAPVFPRSKVTALKANGEDGLKDDVADKNWRLNVTGYGPKPAALKLDLSALRSLPRVEHVTEFKCIEGWSSVVHWAGARLSDFTQAYVPGAEHAQYVGLQTPNEEYYVGIDMPSALHPQTLLCYEMNGAPLTKEHGAPLRLVIPVKYGIKNLKRIGSMTYTDSRPPDFWAEQGYDYYAGL